MAASTRVQKLIIEITVDENKKKRPKFGLICLYSSSRCKKYPRIVHQSLKYSIDNYFIFTCLISVRGA